MSKRKDPTEGANFFSLSTEHCVECVNRGLGAVPAVKFTGHVHVYGDRTKVTSGWCEAHSADNSLEKAALDEYGCNGCDGPWKSVMGVRVRT